MNGKEKIRGNFKEDRTVESANFEIRKKKEIKKQERKFKKKEKKGLSVALKVALKICGPQLMLLDFDPHIWPK